MLGRNGNSKGRRMHHVFDVSVHLCVRVCLPGGDIFQHQLARTNP